VSVYARADLPHWDFPRTPASVALLVGYGREQGLTAADLLAGSGLTEHTLTDPDATVTARQELAVVTNLVRARWRGPGLGIAAGGRYHVGTFGIFGYACLTSPTLGDAIRFAVRYYDLTYGFCLPTVTVDGPTATLALELPDLTGPVAAFLIERDLAAIATVMSEVVGGPLQFSAVSFAHGSADQALSTEPFGTVTFGATAPTVSFPAGVLDRPLPQASPMTVALCEAQCRELLTRRRSRTGVAQQVRDQLIRIDGAAHTIASVARVLAMSERTLRRRLADEHTSFRQLFEEVHRTLAEELLGTGALSVGDVAVRLGYAEASSFIAAFKRWTGTTPARSQRAGLRGRRFA